MRTDEILNEVLKPDYLNETKKVVTNVVTALCETYDITPLFLLSLVMFAEDVQGYYCAKNSEASEGQTFTDDRGVIHKNPAVRIAYDYHVNIEKFMKEYGLTLLSEKKLNGRADEESPLTEFLKGN